MSNAGMKTLMCVLLFAVIDGFVVHDLIKRPMSFQKLYDFVNDGRFNDFSYGNMQITYMNCVKLVDCLQIMHEEYSKMISDITESITAIEQKLKDYARTVVSILEDYKSFSLSEKFVVDTVNIIENIVFAEPHMHCVLEFLYNQNHDITSKFPVYMFFDVRAEHLRKNVVNVAELIKLVAEFFDIGNPGVAEDEGLTKWTRIDYEPDEIPKIPDLIETPTEPTTEPTTESTTEPTTEPTTVAQQPSLNDINYNAWKASLKILQDDDDLEIKKYEEKFPTQPLAEHPFGNNYNVNDVIQGSILKKTKPKSSETSVPIRMQKKAQKINFKNHVFRKMQMLRKKDTTLKTLTEPFCKIATNSFSYDSLMWGSLTSIEDKVITKVPLSDVKPKVP